MTAWVWDGTSKPVFLTCFQMISTEDHILKNQASQQISRHQAVGDGFFLLFQEKFS